MSNVPATSQLISIHRSHPLFDLVIDSAELPSGSIATILDWLLSVGRVGGKKRFQAAADGWQRAALDLEPELKAIAAVDHVNSLTAQTDDAATGAVEREDQLSLRRDEAGDVIGCSLQGLHIFQKRPKLLRLKVSAEGPVESAGHNLHIAIDPRPLARVEQPGQAARQRSNLYVLSVWITNQNVWTLSHSTLLPARARSSGELRNDAELLIARQKVERVPAFDELLIDPSSEAHP
jgi:hypothetical protein